MRTLNRRRTIALVATAASLVAVSSIDMAQSQDGKKPTITKYDLQKTIYTMVSGVYEDAKNYGIPVQENYIKEVSAQIFPDVEVISQRRVTITEK
jgi:acid phosphatase class B